VKQLYLNITTTYENKTILNIFYLCYYVFLVFSVSKMETDLFESQTTKLTSTFSNRTTADVTTKLDKQESLKKQLYDAASNGDTDIVRQILLHKPEIDIVRDGECCSDDDDTTEEPNFLMIAAMNGHVGVVRELIDYGANPNIKLKYYTEREFEYKFELEYKFVAPINALMMAANNGHVEVVKELIKYGADPNEFTKYSCFNAPINVLMVAANNGHLEVVRELLNHGVDPNDYDSTYHSLTSEPINAIMMAAKHSHVEVVRELLSHGAYSNITTVCHSVVTDTKYNEDYRKYNQSPLYFALEGGNSDIVSMLLSNGAKISNDLKAYYKISKSFERKGEEYTNIIVDKKGRKMYPMSISIIQIFDSYYAKSLYNS